MPSASLGRLCAVLAVAVVVLGCGSPSAKEFRAEATRVCTEYQKDVFALRMPTNQMEAKVVAAQARREERELFADLKDVDAPSELRKRFERAVKAGSHEKAQDDMLALRLRACAGPGVMALPMEQVHIDDSTGACASSVRALEDHIRTKRGVEQARGVASELRLLARELYVERAPREAAKLWGAAIKTMYATARKVVALSRATDRLEAQRIEDELVELLYTGDAQWRALNLEDCVDVYPTLGGGGGEGS